MTRDETGIQAAVVGRVEVEVEVEVEAQMRSQWRLRLRLTSFLNFYFDNLRVGDDVDRAIKFRHDKPAQ